MFNPKQNILDQQLAESGVELSIDPVSVGMAAFSIGSSIFGAKKQSDAASRSRKASKKQRKKQYKYDKEAYEMSGERLKATREEQIRAIKLQRKNDKILARFKDRNAMRSYRDALKIRNLQNKQNKRLFRKSEMLYQQALNFNELTAKQAKQTQLRALQEETQKYAFANENAILESMIAKGQAQARGQAGKSAAKAAQSELAALGRNQATMVESLVSARANTQMQLFNIQRQHLAADLDAFSKRMLKPIKMPKPVKPIKTPLTKYKMPRELKPFDFGPEPIKGTVSMSGPSFGSALAQQLPSIVQAATPLVSQAFNLNQGQQTLGTNFSMQYSNLFGQDTAPFNANMQSFSTPSQVNTSSLFTPAT